MREPVRQAWAWLLLAVWSLVAPVCAAEPVSTTPWVSIEQPLPFFAVHGLDLSGDSVSVLVSSAQAESYLVGFPLGSLEARKETLLQHFYDGFQSTPMGTLLWISSRGSDGRLSWLESSGKERSIWEGPVLSTVSPRWALPKSTEGKIWWVTAIEDEPRVASLKFPPEREAEPIYAPPLPDTKATPVAFAGDHAVAGVDSQEEPFLLAWSSGASLWQRLPTSPGLAVVGASGSVVLALEPSKRQLMALDLEAQPREWFSLYTAPPEGEIEAEHVRATSESGDASLLERSPTGVRFVTLSRTGPRAWNAAVVTPDLLEPEHWVSNGASWLAIKRQPSRYLFVGRWSGTELPAVTPSSPEVKKVSAVEVREPSAEVEWRPSPQPRGRALEWLRSQVGPSFATPSGPGRLIDSYEDEVEAGWTYDAALASITFMAAGETRLARHLLRGLDRLQESDGSWAFSYHPTEAWPLGEEKYVGAMAWVIMAANFYEWHSGDSSFADMARRGLAYLATFLQDDEAQKTFGAISMGPANPKAYSVEHNLNSYSAFYWRGRLDGNAEYLEIARAIRKFVIQEQWASPEEGYEFGYFRAGYRDDDFYLDAQSWNVLALIDTGVDEERFRIALDSVERRLKVTDGQLGSLTDIVGFNETSGFTISDKVWGEGSEGVVAAFLALGEPHRAAVYHAQTRRYQSESGGIPYATENGDAWPVAPSVASTAWFVLNELEPWRNPFQPGLGGVARRRP